MKVFVLFTAGYRKENNFNWWYHVAPYVNVKGTDGEYEIVLDPSYEKLPISLKKWVFHFASKANSCRKLKSLHDYKATEDEGGCVVITASMYHYTPQDLDPENPLWAGDAKIFEIFKKLCGLLLLIKTGQIILLSYPITVIRS